MPQGGSSGCLYYIVNDGNDTNAQYVTSLFGLSPEFLNNIQIQVNFYDDVNGSGNLINSFSDNLQLHIYNGSSFRSFGIVNSYDLNLIKSGKLSLSCGNIVYSTMLTSADLSGLLDGYYIGFDFLMPYCIKTFTRES